MAHKDNGRGRIAHRVNKYKSISVSSCLRGEFDLTQRPPIPYAPRFTRFTESTMHNSSGISISELAALVRGTVIGEGTHIVRACNTLMDAAPDQISLLHNAKYAKELDTTRAGCVVIAPGALGEVKRAAGLPPLNAIEAKNTYHAWQQIMVRLHGQRKHPPVGISPLASIAPSAKIGNNVHIHPFAVVGENVTIGDN